jgi:isochorismate pyruvate lyase
MTLQDIRNEIDAIDFKLLELLKQRQDFVKQASQFKTTREGETGVIVPSRIESMLIERDKRANDLGLDEKFVKELFELIIEHMIEIEMREWESNDRSAK